MRTVIVEGIKYIAIQDILPEIDYMYSEEGNADAVNLAVDLSEKLSTLERDS
jgi:hypothetical protein